MAKEGNSSLMFMTGVVLGSVVGAAVAVLFAPASGEEVRQKLALTGKKVVRDVKKNAQQVAVELEPKLDAMKKEFLDKVEEVKEGFDVGHKTVTKRPAPRR